MAFGLVAYNNSNKLTLSTDGILYGYAGQATYVSTTSAGTSVSEALAGYMTYTFSWSGRIIVVLPLKTGYYTGLVDLTQSGGVWTIKIQNGNSFDSLGFLVNTTTEVYIFKEPSTPSGYGMALFNSSGQCCADLTIRPLTYKGTANFSSSSTSATRPGGVTSPAVMAMPPGDGKGTTTFNGVRWDIRLYDYYWTVDSSNVYRAAVLKERYQDDGAAITAYDDLPSTSPFIIDVNGLP
jgi:hypothetical protein